MIQTLEDMIRRFCAYDLEFKDSYGFTHGWNPKHPVDTLKKDLVDIHPAASSFKLLLDEVRHNANKRINDAFEYTKQKWDKSHENPEFKVGDSILASTFNFNNIKGPKKFKDSFSGPFIKYR
ncbi:hypothetical protein O181_106410 [Austropuccinia psidii MF-1]|uniref:Uncharacterized protein n=1 Tax=Austropuccinia psidii MF-1 TaxID=1389203 RepID=A0A9Q3JSG1_9BASI|nr:hypothetical protein [Austropuccinia psidii MF-1]